MGNASQLSRLAKLDRDIERQADDATVRLMRHRWEAIHEQGFTVREYAKAIGRSHSLVARYVKAYELRRVNAELTPADALERASHSDDRNIAIEAVARADDIGLAHVRQSRMPEVRRVQQVIAEAPAEEREERARRYVETTRMSNKAREANNARRRANTMQSVIDLEVELDKANRALRNALGISRDADFSDEDLHARIANVLSEVRLLVEQVSMQILGRTEVDWDSELSQLRGED